MQFPKNENLLKTFLTFCWFLHISFINSESIEYCDKSEKESKITKQNQGSPSSDTCQNTAPMALVLYNEDNVLPLHRDKRTLKYVSRDIVIKQEWKKLGVAAVVWDAAEVLSAYLEENPHLVRGRNTIELGAGTGLVGIVAALLGSHVTITDREEVLDFLKETVSQNLPEDLLGRTEIRALDWTKDINNFPDPFDVILGADIVYIEEVFEDLLRTLLKLSNRDTLVLLSCRIRYERDNYFLDRLREHFIVNQILYDELKDVILFQATKL
ncbi:protein N-lysine methyltransferase METTL21A-like [Dreissena polymorpha]|uniref:Protein N-lysine methyltransferase METTL21A n=1 Tax=Dreissena polymorpha TaxID=45954 RepID=A0A9D3YVU4_DREPO|nr:protein N-lysine methyltransferase METTL21A-like [Dreissena polymorpha]KAH3708308.1 hypothetical protein DPMN_067755 [Dreissena polymorpha]